MVKKEKSTNRISSCQTTLRLSCSVTRDSFRPQIHKVPQGTTDPRRRDQDVWSGPVSHVHPLPEMDGHQDWLPTLLPCRFSRLRRNVR